MNWEAIGAIGEIIGAMAVVATIFYLGRQIRTEAQRARTNPIAIVPDAFPMPYKAWLTQNTSYP